MYNSLITERTVGIATISNENYSDSGMLQMSATSATDNYTQGPKFSRYRSVRRAAAAVIPEDAPSLPEPSANQLTRGPSRYRRAQKPRAQTVPLPGRPSAEPSPSAPPVQHKSVPVAVKSNSITNNVPIQPAHPSVRQNSSPHRQSDHEFRGGPVQSSPLPKIVSPVRECQLSRKTTNASRSPSTAIPKSYEAAREEARMILEGEYDRIQNLKELEKRTDRKREVHRAELKRQTSPIQQPLPPPVYVDAPVLKVQRKVEKRLPDKYHDAPKSVGERVQVPARQVRPDPRYQNDQSTPIQAHHPIDAPTPAIQRHKEIPKFDAPISAVNAGGRRVEVRLNNAERGITLPVTPITNARDLINSASVVMSETFDPRTAVLVESFSKLGLERPLRRYEHIRDVMNSWDTDNQNYLTIMSQSEYQTNGLERDDVPEEISGRTMVQMYLSLRPGKWDKRWIILRPDGQVTISKRENDGDGTNICHLSDFDVYTPTAKHRKKLKPPKKICFAVKSQQKSAMFLEGINFVHFFATSEKQTADLWYTAIQSWRSWYLVHVLGEGACKVKDTGVVSAATGDTDARLATGPSRESIPYQLGSFKPLLDLSDLDLEFSHTHARSSAQMALKKQSVELDVGKTSLDVGPNELVRQASRSRSTIPMSLRAKLISEAENRRGSGPDCSLDSDQAFTGGGLLGRSMSTRRSQGGKASGHGVSGHPGRPLVDLTPASNFAEGSLLRKLEAWSAAQGDHEPKVDRQKRLEADIKVGEGIA